MKAIKLFIGAGFGSGYSPKAPGTAGSLLSIVPLYFILQINPLFGPIIFALLASILTLWVSSICEEEWGKDPGTVVMDEFAGQAIVFISIPLFGDIGSDLLLMGLGFALFRVFDIWKPLGINRVQNLGGGWGILLDDLIAGFYAFICLKTLIFLAPNVFDLAG